MAELSINHQSRILALKSECNNFKAETMRKIDDLTNEIAANNGFREASKLSCIAGRLELFINELNEF